MNTDELKGSAKDVKGGIKKSVGKVTGDDKMQAEGMLGKAAGSIQKGLGEAKDKAKKVVDKIKK